MEKAYQTDYVAISYEQPILAMCWKRPVERNEFRRGYLQMFVTAKQLQAKWWMIDTRQRGFTSADELGWLSTELFPRMMRDLGDCNCLSYVVSPDQYDQLLSSNGGSPVLSLSSFIQIRLFRDENEANHWLQAELQQAS